MTANWTSEDIDEVENIYIGLWSSPVAGPKLKVFIDAVRRLPPHIVVEALEWVAKTQERDIRPSISVIVACARERMPKPLRQPSPCDNDDGEDRLTFREYYRQRKDIDVPHFMHKFLDDDDPRKLRRTTESDTRDIKDLDLQPDTDIPQHISADALGKAVEGL